MIPIAWWLLADWFVLLVFVSSCGHQCAIGDGVGNLTGVAHFVGDDVGCCY